jgi:hypothetical protein
MGQKVDRKWSEKSLNLSRIRQKLTKVGHFFVRIRSFFCHFWSLFRSLFDPLFFGDPPLFRGGHVNRGVICRFSTVTYPPLKLTLGGHFFGGRDEIRQKMGQKVDRKWSEKSLNLSRIRRKLTRIRQKLTRIRHFFDQNSSLFWSEFVTFLTRIRHFFGPPPETSTPPFPGGDT